MDTNPVLLKSSMFGGFKKKDVLSYIFELNETTQDEKQKLAEQIEELLQSRDAFSKRAEEAERELAELKGELDDKSAGLEREIAKSMQLSQLSEKLKAEALTHENTISQQNTELARQTELNAVLSEKNRGFEEKRRQVDLAASQISDLLKQARSDAENVVNRAKLEAEKIIKDAKASIEAHVEEANKSTDDAYKKFISFNSGLESLHETVLKATASINDNMQSLKDAVSNIESFIPEKLKADALPVLQYKEEEKQELHEVKGTNASAVTAAAIAPPRPVEDEADDMTRDILRSYGVRKDDSGFFRLASDR